MKFVGVLSGHEPVVIGTFYLELRKRVGEAIKHLPRHPLRAKFMFFVDILSLLFMILCGVYIGLKVDYVNPVVLVAVSYLAHEFHSRVAGQVHATMHMQVFGDSFVRYAEYILTALGGRSTPGMSLPSEKMQYRKLLNMKSRRTSADEFGSRQRGPYEHQVSRAIHRSRLSFIAEIIKYPVVVIFRRYIMFEAVHLMKTTALVLRASTVSFGSHRKTTGNQCMRYRQTFSQEIFSFLSGTCLPICCFGF
jgi:hypothetical protein